MKTFIVISLLTAVAGPAAHAADTYGAIAYSETTGAFGSATGYPSYARAELAAVRRCGQLDCAAVVSVRNGCAALAVGLGYAYGWGRDASSASAESRAMSECSARATNCAIVSSICSYN